MLYRSNPEPQACRGRPLRVSILLLDTPDLASGERSPAPAHRLRRTLMGQDVGRRLAMTVPAILLLWAAVAWALGWAG